MRRMIPEKKIEILNKMNFNGETLEINAPIESENQWKVELDDSSFIINTGWTVENIYSALYVTNNKLIGVFLVKATNGTESAGTPNIYTKDIELPIKYAEKIYDYNGETAASGAGNVNIAIINGSTSPTNNSRGSATNGCIYNSTAANKIAIFLPINSANAGASFYSEMRFFLSLE